LAKGTSIEWARHPLTGLGASWNPIVAVRRDTGKVGFHCEHVTEACRFCYAEAFNVRNLPGRGTGLEYKPGNLDKVRIMADHDTLLQPFSWKEPRGIFVCSTTDLFGGFVAPVLVDGVFAVAALNPHHIFYVLTKRPQLAAQYTNMGYAKVLPEQGIRRVMEQLRPGSRDVQFTWPLPNVWIGTSVHDQDSANTFIPQLLRAQAAVHWISAEPLLGPIDFRAVPPIPDRRGRISWVAAGGESGTKARLVPELPDILRSLRDQSAEFGAAFHFKQWGTWAWAPDNLNFEQAASWGRERFFDPEKPDRRLPKPRHHSNGRTAFRVGKTRAGRELDGRVHDAFPEVAA
jgi:protein gp37